MEIDEGATSPEDAEATSEGDGTAESQFVVGTYKTKDEAEKGIKEKDRYISELKARVQQAEDLKKVLETVTKGKEQKAEQPREPDLNLEELTTEWAEGDPQKQFSVLSKLLSHNEKRLSQQQQQQMQTVLERIESIGAKLETVDPVYVQTNDRVVELAEKIGADANDPATRKLLMKLAKSELEGDSHPNRPMIPGGMRSTGVSAQASDARKQAEKEMDAMADQFVSKVMPKRRK